ncbi:MAG: DUF2163 domain-containing protein [Rhizomicrobium sp.]
MKTLDADFQAHLSSGATTLCWCWLVTRLDGVVLGFTDHDADLCCDGVTYAAATGLSATEIQSQKDYAVDNMEIAGAFSAAALTEADLSAGLYDGATVEILRVNWQTPSQYVLIRKGWLGEIKRGHSGFQAEIRGLMQQLQQSVGRSFCYLCDADVGDSRCGIDVTASGLCGSGAISTVTDNRRFTVTDLSAFSTGWFTGGKLSWTSGANKGLSCEVKRHGKSSAAVSIEIWLAASQDVAAGDGFTVTVGCNKKFSTCKSKFANAANHRGFPYMIGNDAVIAYAYGATDLDGGSRYGN